MNNKDTCLKRKTISLEKFAILLPKPLTGSGVSSRLVYWSVHRRTGRSSATSLWDNTFPQSMHFRSGENFLGQVLEYAWVRLGPVYLPVEPILKEVESINSMAVTPTPETPLVAKFCQPSTVFAIACVSLSLVALSSIWRNRKSVITERKPTTSKGELTIIHEDEGYKSEEEAPAKSETPAPLSRIAQLLSDCSRVLRIVNSNNPETEEEALVMSTLSAEIPMSIATLCQIQQLLSVHYDILNSQQGLKTCFETIMSGLAVVISSLDGELATLGTCKCRSHKSPVEMTSTFKRIEQVTEKLRDQRQSLLFIADSYQRASEAANLATASKSLAVPVATSSSSAHTPGSDLKSFMENPPDVDELPEYSPPRNSEVIAPDTKGPPSHIVEIDSQPVKPQPTGSVANLFAAILSDSPEELESYLKDGVDLNTPHGRLQRYAMHEAARLNRASCASILIRYGALADCEDGKGDSPLHLASWEGNVEVGFVLLSAGVEIDRLSGRDGYSPLWCAISARHVDMARLLIKHGARVSMKAPSDSLPLHQAAITGQSAMAELLIDAGANVDSVDREMNTPLHYAATIGDIRTAKMLIREKADANAKQERGLTPLHWACHKGHEEMAKLLIESGAMINAKSETFASPLVCAAARGHLGCVKVLVRKGADCRVVTTEWDGVSGTAEEIARGRGFGSIASFIDEYAAKK